MSPETATVDHPTLDAATFSTLLERAITEPGVISAAYTAFYGYSLGNRLLAYVQCMERELTPGPIATFMGWKEKGRFVSKGAKALRLCMPVTVKRRGEAQADGTTTDDATFTRFIFKNNWFVLAQTEGADVTLLNEPEWQAERALSVLNVTRGAFLAQNGNVQGHAADRTIAISPVAALPHKTFFHELAHVMLGHTAEGALSDDERTPRNLREVEAEAVALVCLEVLGLPGAEFSRGYIQHWNQTRSAEPIPERSAQKIFKAADQILKDGRPAVEEA
jgi:hypothetical protein